MTKRATTQDKPLVMSDALTSNNADEAADPLSLSGAWPSQVQRTCRGVSRECHVVIEALQQVFDHDEEARAQQMTRRPASRTTRPANHGRASAVA